MVAPWVPRMHLFEIDDQPWFPPWFRAKVQAALTQTWNSQIPYLQPVSPARIVSRLLEAHLGDSLSDHVFIDFCAGAGGPTPSIERYINKDSQPKEPIQFVLTDLHPHIENWTRAARRSPNIHFSPDQIDASDAPPDLLTNHLNNNSNNALANNPEGKVPNKKKKKKKKHFRLFNLAFHHFDDPLARRILANTLETSDGFAIFELQDRSFRSFLSCCLLGIGVLLSAPLFAWRWRSPGTLFWCWAAPVLPFVLVFDGWVSALRTRTPDEVEALMRTCGVDEKEVDKWEVRSGRECHLPPVADLNWIICTKKTRA
ncbi:hypothetical protein DHEL01_v204200 [Diaporthe helianthi]|uniref:Methyltransferase domain-containing protein n=1 Tax=Diaporthe helianthi TaxID=158607 RepID=A0A2P5I4H7_DIAHE|nr:hypothetical protein DHEL01_v204200 [Diaporthe helianthi]